MYNNILSQGARGGFTSLYLSTVITETPRAGENIPAGAGPGLSSYPDISGNATTIDKDDIVPTCLDTVSRPIVMDMYNHVNTLALDNHARTHAHAFALVHAHIDVRYMDDIAK